MEAILLCVLDASATAAQHALIDRISLSLTKREAELVFIGDQTAAAAVPPQSVFAIRFHRWADAESFLEGFQMLLGAEDCEAARLGIQLLHPRPSTIGNPPLPPMFP
jgi:hypothetical protein